jgi:hypothetical protein
MGEIDKTDTFKGKTDFLPQVINGILRNGYIMQDPSIVIRKKVSPSFPGSNQLNSLRTFSL